CGCCGSTAPAGRTYTPALIAGTRKNSRYSFRRSARSRLSSETSKKCFTAPPLCSRPGSSRTRRSLERSREEDVSVVTDQVFPAERAFGVIPLVNPVDHTQQRECGRPWVHDGARLPDSLNFCHQVLHKMNVIFLPRINPPAQRGRQRMIFVQHDGDLAIAGAEHHVDVQANQRA